MNQETIVLSALKTRTSKGITQADMLKHGVFRLAARINDLRSKGHDIHCQSEIGVNQYGNQVRYGRYFLQGSD
jgi:hypothetical protein